MAWKFYEVCSLCVFLAGSSICTLSLVGRAAAVGEGGNGVGLVDTQGQGKFKG